jgi:hypothetical protein
MSGLDAPGWSHPRIPESDGASMRLTFAWRRERFNRPVVA